jgi:hypothetical protein
MFGPAWSSQRANDDQFSPHADGHCERHPDRELCGSILSDPVGPETDGQAYQPVGAVPTPIRRFGRISCLTDSVRRIPGEALEPDSVMSGKALKAPTGPKTAPQIKLPFFYGWLLVGVSFDHDGDWGQRPHGLFSAVPAAP